MLIRPLAALAACWALSVPAWAQSPQLRVAEDEDWCNDEYSEHDRSRTCTVYEATWAGGAPISVDARPNGGIHVQGWNRSEVRLRAKVVTMAEDEAEARQIASQVRIQAGPTVRAEGPSREGRNRGWWVSYRLDVPQRSSLRLESTNGGIHLAGVEGDIEFTTTNGGLHLRDVAGHVKGRTTNGGVHVDLEGTQWRGEGLDVATSNGGVHLQLPRGYNARLDVGTTNGRVHGGIAGAEPPDEDGEDAAMRRGHRGRRNLSLVLGSGGAPLRIRTTNGGVHVDER